MQLSKQLTVMRMTGASRMCAKPLFTLYVSNSQIPNTFSRAGHLHRIQVSFHHHRIWKNDSKKKATTNGKIPLAANGLDKGKKIFKAGEGVSHESLQTLISSESSSRLYSKKSTRFDFERMKQEALNKERGTQDEASKQSKSLWDKLKEVFLAFIGIELIPNLIVSATPMLIFLALYQAGAIGYWIYLHYKILNSWEYANGIVKDLKVVQTTGDKDGFLYLPVIVYEYITKDGKRFTSDQYFFLNSLTNSPDSARVVIKKTLNHAKDSRLEASQDKLSTLERQLSKFSPQSTKHATAERRYSLEKEYLENKDSQFLSVRYNPEFKSVARVENPSKAEIYGAQISALWGNIFTKTILPLIAFSTLGFLSVRKANLTLVKWSQLGMMLAVPTSIPLGYYISYRDNNKQFTSYMYKEEEEVDATL